MSPTYTQASTQDRLLERWACIGLGLATDCLGVIGDFLRFYIYLVEGVFLGVFRAISCKRMNFFVKSVHILSLVSLLTYQYGHLAAPIRYLWAPNRFTL